MGGTVFVDESKHRGYFLVASVHLAGDLDELRKLMRGLVLPGQRRVHMSKERDSRRREIAAVICRAAVTATIYDAHRHHHDRDARAACLHALVDDAAARAGEVMLVLEQDDSILESDRRQLFALTRERPAVRYQHQRAAAEQLLAIPDAIAWCWAKGGDWRRRIQPAVTVVRAV